jgi:DNA modification methylase
LESGENDGRRKKERMTWKIWNEDCLDTLEFMLNDSVDLTVTSPPYDNLRTYNGYCFRFEEVAQELYRVTKSGGVVVWNVNDATVDGSETGTSFRQALYFKECGFNLHDTMIWVKPSPPPQTKVGMRYTSATEYMFVLTKGRPKTFNPIHIPCDTAGKKSGGKTQTAPNGSTRLDRVVAREGKTVKDTKPMTNAWVMSHNTNGVGHPAVFPETLAKNHILSWSNKGDLVFDPFVGSGTTGKVARELGRRFIGADISNEYAEMARRRIAESEAANDDEL